MTTVAQLIEKLKEYPQDAIVEVLNEYSVGYENCTSVVSIDLDSITVLDYNDSRYKTYRIHGKVFVQLRALK